MEFINILIATITAAVLLSLAVSFICFLKVFYSPKRKNTGSEVIDIPDGEIYEEYRKEMTDWVISTRAMDSKEYKIKSIDGLDLYARYYEYQKGAPIEILFHGYKGNAERDLSGGVERCFSLGRNALIVDQRAHGKSDGSVISFGVKERFDCLEWTKFAVKEFGEDSTIILTGISMGGATVMMASDLDLPQNVVCILSDCGYSSPSKIIEKVVRDLRLPAPLLMPFVKLGARIFGRFDLDESSALQSVKKTSIPIIFIHGDTDDFVPYEMSAECYDACASTKSLVKVAGAGHGLAYPKDKQLYLTSLSDFQKRCGF